MTEDRFSNIPSEDDQNNVADRGRTSIGSGRSTELSVNDMPHDDDLDPNPIISRKNQRRQSWTAMFAILIVTLLLMFGPIKDERLKIIAEPIVWFYFTMGSIVVAYHGATTWFQKSLPNRGGGYGRR